jgi:hypothetical protein
MRRGNGSRRLAKLVAKPEDWQHFLEMAATWDMLAKQRPSDKLAATWALAEKAEAKLNEWKKSKCESGLYYRSDNRDALNRLGRVCDPC